MAISQDSAAMRESSQRELEASRNILEAAEAAAVDAACKVRVEQRRLERVEIKAIEPSRRQDNQVVTKKPSVSIGGPSPVDPRRAPLALLPLARPLLRRRLGAALGDAAARRRRRGRGRRLRLLLTGIWAC